MLTQLAYFPLFGLPLIAWGGLTTAVLLIITLIIGIQNSRKANKTAKDDKNFFILAVITIVLGLGHGMLGLIINLLR